MSIRLMISSEDEIRIINNNGQIITTKLKGEVKNINDQGHVVTTKLKSETTVDLSTSCNKAVAVAELLGWMKGPRFQKVMVVLTNDNGDTYVDLFRLLNEDENFLQDMLSHMRNVTNRELAAAADAGAPHEELKEKKVALTNIDSLIHNTSMYLTDIDEELAKDSASALEIDQKISEEKGITYITKASIDRWAKNKYGISILDDQEQHPSSEGIQVQSTTQDKEEYLDTKNGLKRLEADSFLTTFAFLIEAFYKVALEDKSIKFGEDKPNVMAIATHIEELARIANKGKILKGQGNQSIKKRINRAMEIKKTNLPQR